MPKRIVVIPLSLNRVTTDDHVWAESALSLNVSTVTTSSNFAPHRLASACWYTSPLAPQSLPAHETMPSFRGLPLMLGSSVKVAGLLTICLQRNSTLASTRRSESSVGLNMYGKFLR